MLQRSTVQKDFLFYRRKYVLFSFQKRYTRPFLLSTHCRPRGSNQTTTMNRFLIQNISEWSFFSFAEDEKMSYPECTFNESRK
jgi:hypothetical protein